MQKVGKVERVEFFQCFLAKSNGPKKWNKHISALSSSIVEEQYFCCLSLVYFL